MTKPHGLLNLYLSPEGQRAWDAGVAEIATKPPVMGGYNHLYFALRHLPRERERGIADTLAS